MAPSVVISAAYGTLGDVAPMLGLAERLLSRSVAVTLVVDAYFLPRARALSGARVETLGTVEEYQALLDDVQGRWSKPADTVRFWLRRLNDHYTLLARLADEAPGQVTFIGHALDLPVRLLQERRGWRARCPGRTAVSPAFHLQLAGNLSRAGCVDEALAMEPDALAALAGMQWRAPAAVAGRAF